MITRIPRSSFSININNTVQTNEHQNLSELFYKELEDKFSGKELATPLLKSFSENCKQNGRHIFSDTDFVIKFSTSVSQADKKEITIINKNENTTLTQTIDPIFEEYLMEMLHQRSDTLDKQESNLNSDRKEKEFPRVKLNGQCYFPGRPQDLIVCRHIAAQYINDIYQNVDYKPRQDDYSSAEKFLTHFNPKCKNQTMALISSRPEGRCVAACGDFGLVMKAYFDKMESNGISVMAAILLVDIHALTARLRIKNTTEGCTHYVVSVYDPNVTNDKIRIMSESKEDIKHYSLMDFINVDYNLLKWSNAHVINQSVAIIPALPKEQLLMLKGSVDEITPPLSPATMNLLMAIGQNHQLTQLMIQLQKMPELQITEMLTAYNSTNHPGLYLAIDNGNADIVETIFNSLSEPGYKGLLSKRNLMHILEAKDKNGFSGLFLAISLKDKNVVTSILNALPKLAATHHLSNRQVYKFLKAKNRSYRSYSTSSHVLSHVMANGDADMLKIFLDALPLLISKCHFTKEQVLDLLKAKDYYYCPGLNKAMSNGHSDIVKVILEALPRLAQEINISASDIVDLLIAKGISFDTGLFTSMYRGHMNVIKTIFNALPTLIDTFKFDKKNMKCLLLVSNGNEYPGLFSAIEHKQHNVVETVYLALSDCARLFGFTAEDIMDFWQHKSLEKYTAFEWALELAQRVIAELIFNTLNKMAESFGFTDNPRYIAEKNYMEALLNKKSPHTVR
ncbi:ShET2/EspL2 family type III secretion system effector toxin [Escherichia coli]|uniref:ShET2/EspL2 family type III secretion system effector toxin n=1 Tax=Escherichia coli TaxID=562 RepID=UPI0038B30815